MINPVILSGGNFCQIVMKVVEFASPGGNNIGGKRRAVVIIRHRIVGLEVQFEKLMQRTMIFKKVQHLAPIYSSL